MMRPVSKPLVRAAAGSAAAFLFVFVLVAVPGGRRLTRAEHRELSALRIDVELLDADPEDLAQHQRVRRERLLRREDELRDRLDEMEADRSGGQAGGLLVRLVVFALGSVFLAIAGAVAHVRFGLFDPALQGEDDPRPPGVR